ncbi:hypothetical protein GGR42_003132 [Saonia flava]|uniref:Glycosyltransferase 2-like domain-containing protein n=1 Tax=Saonia flava TaxID=523696 RepID=A0A846QWC7_9FLAO|nr:glycosyltransferase family 2 protein [Saonia flava]NJB72641.1 hypothetical protein [Saonia flava]
MGSKHKVIIVLVNYNSFNDTSACIKSINEVNGEKPFVVLVDNNSRDKENLKNLPSVYKNIKILFNEANIGFGRANNMGIKWALKNLNFEYILLLNNDTLIEPNTISWLIEPYLEDSSIGITTGKTFYEANREIVWYGGGEINYLRGWPKIANYNQLPSDEGANQSRYVSFISGCTMMFSKNSINKIKGFDDDYFMYCEDLELCIRAKKMGYKLFYESNAIIYHKVQGSTKMGNNEFTGDHPKNPNLAFLFYHMKTNQYLTFKKHLKGYKRFKFKIVYWMEFTYKALRYLLCQRFDMLETYKKVLIKNLK